MGTLLSLPQGLANADAWACASCPAGAAATSGLHHYTMPLPPALRSFQNRGLYADPATIFSSAVLLIILLALSFRRILGLDRIMDQALR